MRLRWRNVYNSGRVDDRTFMHDGRVHSISWFMPPGNKVEAHGEIHLVHGWYKDLGLILNPNDDSHIKIVNRSDCKFLDEPKEKQPIRVNNTQFKTVGQLKQDQKFLFGNVVFTVMYHNDEAEQTICKINDQEAYCFIMQHAGVLLLE